MMAENVEIFERRVGAFGLKREQNGSLSISRDNQDLIINATVLISDVKSEKNANCMLK